MLGNYSCFCCCLPNFFKMNFSKNSFRYTTRVSNFSDQDQDQHNLSVQIWVQTVYKSYEQNFLCFCCHLLTFLFKTIFFKKFFQEHNQGVKIRLDIFCRSKPGSKLFVKVISRIFSCFCCHLLIFFFKVNFLKKFLQEHDQSVICFYRYLSVMMFEKDYQQTSSHS